MKLNKRAVALLVSLVVLLTVAVGATIAFLADKTPEVKNEFTPSRVACAVTKDPTNHIYTVQNTGDTTAYIRVAVVVNWVNADNKQVYAQAPSFTVTPKNANWILGTDGYYYYKLPVAAGAYIDETLTVMLDDGSIVPTGHTLQVEVVASAIQATVVAVNDWSDGVATAASDGAILTIQAQ